MKLPITARLRNACTDMLEEPRAIPNCGMLREAADVIEELVEALETWSRWAKHLHLPQYAVEQTNALLAKIGLPTNGENSG